MEGEDREVSLLTELRAEVWRWRQGGESDQNGSVGPEV